MARTEGLVTHAFLLACTYTAGLVIGIPMLLLALWLQEAHYFKASLYLMSVALLFLGAAMVAGLLLMLTARRQR